VLWYWLLVSPALLLAVLGLLGERRREEYALARLSAKPGALPPATVIVPVKGDDQGLRENLAALASLDYPDYELIVVAHSAADIPPGVLPGRVKVVLAHGADPNTGEKVQNLQAAVRATRKQSQIFAFADSDGRPTRGWLRALAAPLAEPNVGASTGYRWFMPQPATFWSLMRGVWDAVALGRLGPGDSAFAWGGAMAIGKETFFAARVHEYWKNTVSDDYALSAAIRAAGLTIAFAPGALTPSFEQLACAPFFRWIRRQMTITRVYNRRLWRLGLVAHVFYCAAMAASVVECVHGYFPAGIALAAQLIPGMMKGWNRAALARRALPEYAPWFHRHAWVHAAFNPIATWVWLIALLSSAASDSIEWRGHRYRLK
jgi:cellulose synthase/poly-beta-1,6-N-acetylglucosamine synthase-like glycosyltransferase